MVRHIRCWIATEVSGDSSSLASGESKRRHLLDRLVLNTEAASPSEMSLFTNRQGVIPQKTSVFTGINTDVSTSNLAERFLVKHKPIMLFLSVYQLKPSVQDNLYTFFLRLSVPNVAALLLTSHPFLWTRFRKVRSFFMSAEPSNMLLTMGIISCLQKCRRFLCDRDRTLLPV